MPEDLDELRKTTKNKWLYADAIAELTKYYLVTLNDEGGISIHRLVQEVIRDSLKNEQAKWQKYCVKIFYKLCYYDFSTVESRRFFLILTSHIESVTNGIADEAANEKVASLYFFWEKVFMNLHITSRLRNTTGKR